MWQTVTLANAIANDDRLELFCCCDLSCIHTSDTTILLLQIEDSSEGEQVENGEAITWFIQSS